MNVDWPSWYPHLRRHGQVETPCACGGGHRLLGYLVHERWALLLVAGGAPGGWAAATSSALAILADMLPPGADRPAPPPVRSDELSAPPHMGGPIFWVRKARG